MKNILFVFGTRPEVIKLAPVILELKKYPDKYNVIVCNTEQQKELSNQTLSYFHLKADINLDCMKPNQSLLEVQTRILTALNGVFASNKIDATIVQGDTMTVLCAALASFYNKIPVFHVEAGLRSYDIYEPFPEEVMRQMASRVTALNFAPTEKNKAALLKENISEKTIFVTGNTVIDALFCLSEETLSQSRAFFSGKGIEINDRLVLITAHRRENHGERIDRILDAVEFLVKKYADHTFVIPVHPNPNVKDKINGRLAEYSNVKFVHGNHDEIERILQDLNIEKVDGILLDLGVSSYQLDERNRGFSYLGSNELDMRMDKTQSLTAKKVVNSYSEEELANIIYQYGEERFSRQIAKNICIERKNKEIVTTEELVNIIEKSIPAFAKKDGHPAKRTFQAIRIEVNNEIKPLYNTVRKCIELLKSGGRLCIITFHSLEDRAVKNAFVDAQGKCTCPKDLPYCVCGAKSEGKIINKKPIIATEEEQEENSRAKSAKLRIFEKR